MADPTENTSQSKSATAPSAGSTEAASLAYLRAAGKLYDRTHGKDAGVYQNGERTGELSLADKAQISENDEHERHLARLRAEGSLSPEKKAEIERRHQETMDRIRVLGETHGEPIGGKPLSPPTPGALAEQENRGFAPFSFGSSFVGQQPTPASPGTESGTANPTRIVTVRTTDANTGEKTDVRVRIPEGSTLSPGEKVGFQIGKDGTAKIIRKPQETQPQPAASPSTSASPSAAPAVNTGFFANNRFLSAQFEKTASSRQKASPAPALAEREVVTTGMNRGGVVLNKPATPKQ